MDITMTPARLKRNSKVPERFSSDSSRYDNGNNNVSNSTGLKIKLKTPIREPLKVKLPRLKRQTIQQDSKDSKITHFFHEGSKIHKIRLPSLASRKNKSTVSVPKEEPTSPADSDNSRIGCGTSTETHSPPVNVCKYNSNNDDQATPRSSPANSPSEKLRIVDSDNIESPPAKMGSEEPSEMNDSGIRCACGVNDDLGVMVECESCSTWQHGHCINVGLEEDAYEGYKCAYCLYPEGSVVSSLHQLTIDDKYASRIKLIETGRLESIEGIEQSCPLSLTEIEDIIRLLKRVMNSARVKIRILTNPSDDTELRIWRNPIWHPDPKTTESLDSNQYFFAFCRNNLRFNVENMLTRMVNRCKVILSEISRMDTAREEGPQAETSHLKQSLQEIHDFAETHLGNLK